MATKKQNRRYIVRKIRRILNQNLDVLTKTSGHFLNGIGYGSGLSKKHLRDNSRDE